MELHARQAVGGNTHLMRSQNGRKRQSSQEAELTGAHESSREPTKQTGRWHPGGIQVANWQVATSLPPGGGIQVANWLPTDTQDKTKRHEENGKVHGKQQDGAAPWERPKTRRAKSKRLCANDCVHLAPYHCVHLSPYRASASEGFG